MKKVKVTWVEKIVRTQVMEFEDDEAGDDEIQDALDPDLSEEIDSSNEVMEVVEFQPE